MVAVNLDRSAYNTLLDQKYSRIVAAEMGCSSSREAEAYEPSGVRYHQGKPQAQCAYGPSPAELKARKKRERRRRGNRNAAITAAIVSGGA